MLASDLFLLSSLWLVPVVGALLVVALPERLPGLIRGVALAVTLVTLGLTLYTLATYLELNPGTTLAARAGANTIDARGDAARLVDAPGDLVARRHWVEAFRIQYFLGVDGISLSLLVLTAGIGVLACVASSGIDRQLRAYYSLYLLLLGATMGVFLALDLFLFFVFFEFMLLPMYFLIGLWGGERREYASLKFLLYTLFGSVFILVAILVLYAFSPAGQPARYSFDVMALTEGSSFLPVAVQAWVFGLFFVGFAVKLPVVPVHTWLPDAHVEAPTPISMVLAGVLLKVGGYGMLRLAWPLAPLGAQALAWPVAIVGVVSILYGALVALGQTDFKRLVAYSSVSHMGYVVLGLAALGMTGNDALGATGALYQMLAHGITSAGMFFLVGVVYERLHTRDLAKMGGLFAPMPAFGGAALVIFFGAMGLPGLCGFIGEVFVLLGTFRASLPLAVLAAMALVLTAGYILWTLQRVLMGRPHKGPGHVAVADLSRREWTVLLPLAVLTVVLGVAPQIVLRWVGPSVDQVVSKVSQATGTKSVAKAPAVTAAGRVAR